MTYIADRLSTEWAQTGQHQGAQQPHTGLASKSVENRSLTGGARTFLLTSPQAPRVVPMFLMTVENTVFKSCFSTACSWYVCRVVSRSVSLPNCTDRHSQHSSDRRWQPHAQQSFRLSLPKLCATNF